jgi:Holliday junction resolvase RusA-like endonuclease
MKEAIVYVIPGDPIPLARPRFGKKKVYDSQRAEKLVWEIMLKNQHGALPELTGPLLLDITFYMPVAQKKMKNKEQLYGRPHQFRPDLSNMIKYVEDIANEIIYHDDCQISSITAKKVYGEPRTEFTVTKLL